MTIEEKLAEAMAESWMGDEVDCADVGSILAPAVRGMFPDRDALIALVQDELGRAFVGGMGLVNLQLSLAPVIADRILKEVEE